MVCEESFVWESLRLRALERKVRRPLFADSGRQGQEHELTGDRAVEWESAYSRQPTRVPGKPVARNGWVGSNCEMKGQGRRAKQDTKGKLNEEPIKGIRVVAAQSFGLAGRRGVEVPVRDVAAARCRPSRPI